MALYFLGTFRVRSWVSLMLLQRPVCYYRPDRSFENDEQPFIAHTAGVTP